MICLQEKIVTGRKTMIYPLNKVNQDKSQRKGRRKKYFCQTRTRYLVQLIKKGKNLTRVRPIMYTLTSNKAIYPSQEKGEMKMK